MRIVHGIVIVCSLFNLIEANTIKTPIYKINRPDPIISSVQKRNGINKRDSYLASLYNDAGSQYLVEISIGTPAQNFYVTLDTGSSDLWVSGPACSTKQCPTGRFSSYSSSTYRSLNKVFNLTYGVGNVNGTYVIDTVSLGGATIQSQQFGLASSTNSILTNQNTVQASYINDTNIFNLATSTTAASSGILGMGFPKLTAASGKGIGLYNPFIFNLVDQGILSKPVFSVFLNTVQPSGWVGELMLGGIDSTKYTGDLAYLPVMALTKKTKRSLPDNASLYYWMVGAQGFSMIDNGNTTLDVTFSKIGGFVLDTGTTLTYLPEAMAESIVSQVAGSYEYSLDEGSGVYLIECRAAHSTAQFELKMTGSSTATSDPVVLTVSASSLVIPLEGTTTETAKFCLFGIAPSPSNIGADLYLVGESLLRSTYLVFDLGENRVGLAAAAGTESAVRGSFVASSGSGLIRSLDLVLFLGFLSIFFFF